MMKRSFAASCILALGFQSPAIALDPISAEPGGIPKDSPDYVLKPKPERWVNATDGNTVMARVYATELIGQWVILLHNDVLRSSDMHDWGTKEKVDDDWVQIVTIESLSAIHHALKNSGLTQFIQD